MLDRCQEVLSARASVTNRSQRGRRRLEKWLRGLAVGCTGGSVGRRRKPETPLSNGGFPPCSTTIPVGEPIPANAMIIIQLRAPYPQ